MEGIYGGTICVLIDMPEVTALPYESLEDHRTYRRFRMPAEIVNRFERRLDSDRQLRKAPSSRTSVHVLSFVRMPNRRRTQARSSGRQL